MGFFVLSEEEIEFQIAGTNLRATIYVCLHDINPFRPYVHYYVHWCTALYI